MPVYYGGIYRKRPRYWYRAKQTNPALLPKGINYSLQGITASYVETPSTATLKTARSQVLGVEPPTVSIDLTAGSLPAWITFSRTSNAWYFNSSGVLTQATANVARFDYNPLTLSARGLLLEDSRTNVVLYNRDLTQAAWSASNITALKDQIGLDGVANSASSIAATSANGTILQSISLASSTRYHTAYIKRLVGSGSIYMTMDGGTTWVDVTYQVNSSWQRVSIPSQTIASPSVGFKIATNGDKIAVDIVQNENGAFATSPIITGAANYNRTQDLAYLTGSAGTIAQAAAGTAIIRVERLEDTDNLAHIFLASGTNRRLLYKNATRGYVNAFDGTNAPGSSDIGASSFLSGPTQFGIAWGASTASLSLNGTTVGTGSLTLGSTVSSVYIGAYGTTPGNTCGWVSYLGFYTDRLSNASLVYATRVSDYALTPSQATLKLNANLTGTTASYAVTPSFATLSVNRKLGLTSSSYAETPSTATLKAARSLTLTSTSYAETASSLTFRRGLTLTSSSYAETPSSLTPKLGWSLVGSTASYTETATPATLKFGVRLVGTSASYAETPSDATLKSGRKLTGTSASYAETPSSLTFGRSLAGTTASYTETPSSLTPKYAAHLIGSLSTIVLTPSTADLVPQQKGGISGQTASYTLTGSSATLKRAAYQSLTSAAYALTPSSATLGRVTHLASSSYALTPTSARFGRGLVETTANYHLTPSTAMLQLDVSLLGNSAQYVLTASGADLIYTPGGTTTDQYTVSGPSVEMLFPDYGVSNPNGDVSFPYKVVRRTA